MKALLGAVICLASMLAFTAPANADTPIDQCVGTWDVVTGGLGNNDSVGFVNADQRVGYNSYDLRSGINELNRLTWDHRKACPGDRIRMTGHSGGAAVVHVWLTENGNRFPGRVSAVLLADPKREPGHTNGPGFATEFPFNIYPGLGGADGNFGGVPTLSVCQVADHICAVQASWDGYLNRGTHQKYNFDVTSYPFGARGYVELYDN